MNSNVAYSASGPNTLESEQVDSDFERVRLYALDCMERWSKVNLARSSQRAIEASLASGEERRRGSKESKRSHSVPEELGEAE